MALLDDLVADLRAESGALDALVADRDGDAWRTMTPAEPWTVADTIGHLTWTDRAALVAATDPDGFGDWAAAQFGDRGLDAVTDHAQAEGAARPGELLATWRAGREQLATALLALPDGVRLPWFGPPMGATSMATARLMETWAHGQDVADALGVERIPTARLRHVCHLAVRTRGFAFGVNERPPPDVDVRVELTAPDGSTWAWGADDATDRVTGSALDFCLLAVQRRHRDDTDVIATGPVADEWLEVIQAFAGPPGPGRAPLGGDA